MVSVALSFSSSTTTCQDVIQLDNTSFVVVFLGDKEIEKREQIGGASIIPFQRYRKRKEKEKKKRRVTELRNSWLAIP